MMKELQALGFDRDMYVRIPNDLQADIL